MNGINITALADLTATVTGPHVEVDVGAIADDDVAKVLLGPERQAYELVHGIALDLRGVARGSKGSPPPGCSDRPMRRCGLNRDCGSKWEFINGWGDQHWTSRRGLGGIER